MSEITIKQPRKIKICYILIKLQQNNLLKLLSVIYVILLDSFCVLLANSQ